MPDGNGGERGHTELSAHTRTYLKRNVLILASVWTLVLGSSLVWNLLVIRRGVQAQATIEARSLFNKDLVYRRWAADRGGVYVPETESTPPNPHLSFVKERDIETPSGKKPTLMNPAYIIRQ